MFLSDTANKNPGHVELSPLMKVVKEGLGIDESSIVFSISPYGLRDESKDSPATPPNGYSRDQPSHPGFKVYGDVFLAKSACLDMALWKIGGAAVTLRLVQIANVSINTVKSDCDFNDDLCRLLMKYLVH